MSLQSALAEITMTVRHPTARLLAYRQAGLALIGVPPCHVPEEILWATGALPVGLWGTEQKVVRAKEYFPSFFCSLLTTDLEMLLNGTLDILDGMVLTGLCDSLKSFSQNVMQAKPSLKVFPLLLPQGEENKASLAYLKSQLIAFAEQLSCVTGKTMTEESLNEAIRLYQQLHQEQRRFVTLAGSHSKTISALTRCDVLKSSSFLSPMDALGLLMEIDEALALLPKESCNVKVVTSGIFFDSRETLAMLDKNGIAIVQDRILYEYGRYGKETPTADLDGLCQRHYSFHSCLFSQSLSFRLAELDKAIKESHPDAVLFLLTKFCDPEEYDYPVLKKHVEAAGLPFLTLEVDQGGESLGQNQTILDALGEMV